MLQTQTTVDIIDAPKGTTYNINGTEYPVKNYVKTVFGCFPEVELKMMSDYKWQLMCLNDRLENPDKYRAQGENVEEHIEKLQKWLAEHEYMKYEE